MPRTEESAPPPFFLDDIAIFIVGHFLKRELIYNPFEYLSRNVNKHGVMQGHNSSVQEKVKSIALPYLLFHLYTLLCFNKLEC